MTPILAYFIKVNIGITIFYAFYRLFVYRDTFFNWRRFALLAFFVISLIYPFMNFQDWIKEQEPMQEFVTVYTTAILPEVNITSTNVNTIWAPAIENILLIGYIIVVALLIIRFITQLMSIFIIAIHSRKDYLCKTQVYILDKPSCPFSFFKWIFIHPALHDEKETKEILAHEGTHAIQWHSIDVIISEIITIGCWINPFAWLLKREVRNNLEYMADNRVILSGHDTKSYQYHLLGLAHQKAAANLYNSFKVLPIKNRITMMNRKRSKSIGKTKYALFIPLAALLLIFSNIETIARNTSSIASKMINSINENSSDEIKNTSIPQTEPQQKKGSHSKIKNPYMAVEQMPVFPGGERALLEYIANNLKYPKEALAKNIEGKVYIRFVVSETGSVEEAEVLRSLNKSCDQEAIRVIESMPNWIPGIQNKTAVPVYYVVPIKFQLEKKTLKSKTRNKVTKQKVYSSLQQMPVYPGGETALLTTIAKNLKYPKKAFNEGKQGKVYVKMVITSDGEVKSPVIIRSLSKECDAEALRVVKLLPKWIPGKQNGKNAAVNYIIPITYKIM